MGFKKIIVTVGFKLLGKGLVSVSKIEPAVTKELKFYDDNFIIELKVFRTNTKVAVKKLGTKFQYLGSKYKGQPNLSVIFKSYDGAFSLVMGQIGVHEGYAQHRFIVKGDLIESMPFIRILYYVEAYLFPEFITRNILKEMPKRSSSKPRAYLGLFTK